MFTSDNYFLWIGAALLAVVIGLLFFRFLKFNKKYRLIVFIASTVALVPAIYLVFVKFIVFAINYEPSQKFDKEQWQQQPDKRWQMADDLINRELLIGKDTNGIQEMLGGNYQRYPGDSVWRYDMGTGGGGLGFSFHSLFVIVKSGKVVSVSRARIND